MIRTLEYHMTRKRMSICLFCGNETSIVDWDLTEVGVYVKKTIKILNHKFVTSLSHTDRVNSLHWYYLIFSLEMEINIRSFDASVILFIWVRLENIIFHLSWRVLWVIADDLPLKILWVVWRHCMYEELFITAISIHIYKNVKNLIHFLTWE